RGLEEGVEHVEAGLVRGEPGAELLHAAERPHRDVPVRFAAPGAAPVLEPEQLPGGFGDERLDGLLVAQPVPPGDGVVGMLLEAAVVVLVADPAAAAVVVLVTDNEAVVVPVIIVNTRDDLAARRLFGREMDLCANHRSLPSWWQGSIVRPVGDWPVALITMR